MNHINLSSSLAPLSGGGGEIHMGSETFLYKIQFQTTSIWSFFWMWCIFLAAFSPKVNVFCLLSTILYFNHINLLNPLAPLPGGVWNGHMRSRTFLYEIQFQTTFIWSFFWCDAYFWQRWVLNWRYFGVFGGLPYNVIT